LDASAFAPIISSILASVPPKETLLHLVKDLTPAPTWSPRKVSLLAQVQSSPESLFQALGLPTTVRAGSFTWDKLDLLIDAHFGSEGSEHFLRGHELEPVPIPDRAYQVTNGTVSGNRIGEPADFPNAGEPAAFLVGRMDGPAIALFLHTDSSNGLPDPTPTDLAESLTRANAGAEVRQAVFLDSVDLGLPAPQTNLVELNAANPAIVPTFLIGGTESRPKPSSDTASTEVSVPAGFVVGLDNAPVGSRSLTSDQERSPDSAVVVAEKATESPALPFGLDRPGREVDLAPALASSPPASERGPSVPRRLVLEILFILGLWQLRIYGQSAAAPDEHKQRPG
jgi:hypothetical protein